MIKFYLVSVLLLFSTIGMAQKTIVGRKILIFTKKIEKDGQKQY